MNRFNVSHGLPLDPISLNYRLLEQYSSKRDASRSSINHELRFGNTRHDGRCSATESWKESNSSSPDATIPYQQPWAIEPHLNHALIPTHPDTGHVPNELPRMMVPFESNPPDWSGSLVASNYSTSPRQLKPDPRRLIDSSRDASDWVQAPNSKSESFYTSSQSVGSQPPHPEPTLTTSPTTAPISPPPSLASSPCHPSQVTKSSPLAKPEVDSEDMRSTSSEPEDTTTDPPYSLLIYQALRSAPGMKLPLQGIYGWFEKNTAKGKDRNSKGWQNSIRHNLSMNAGFEAVREESTPGKKAVNFWRLTDEAVSNGIQSTTRYRKQANYKKSIVSEPPAPQRQRSGAKGGKATKITARFRGNIGQDELRKERCRQRIISSQRQLQKSIYGQYLQSPAIAFPTSLHVHGPPVPMTRSSTEFDLGHIVGCADPPPCTPMFCDMAGPGPDCLALDTGLMGWGELHSFPNSLLTGPEISADLHLGL